MGTVQVLQLCLTCGGFWPCEDCYNGKPDPEHRMVVTYDGERLVDQHDEVLYIGVWVPIR